MPPVELREHYNKVKQRAQEKYGLEIMASAK